MTATTLPEIPYGIGLGPNTVQIYADELGLNLSAWHAHVSSRRSIVVFSRETALHSHRIVVYPNQSKIVHKVWRR